MHYEDLNRPASQSVYYTHGRVRFVYVCPIEGLGERACWETLTDGSSRSVAVDRWRIINHQPDTLADSMLSPERIPRDPQCAFANTSDLRDCFALLNEWFLIDWKKGVKRGEERGGREKKKTADATQLELSVVNEPRCLRDKEDECVCVCDLILTVSLKDWHTIVAHFLRSDTA